jgi:hypothetical protein
MGEMVSAYAVVVHEVDDAGFNRRSPAQIRFDLIRHTALLAGGVVFEAVGLGALWRL